MRAALVALALVAAARSCDVSIDLSHYDHFSAAQAAVRARLAAESSTSTSDLVVCVGPGTIAAPIHFTHEDSLANRRVVWRAAPGTVVSGGAAVTGWQAAAGAPNLYVAPVPPGAKGTVIRQLWVDGARASRSSLTDFSAFGKMTPWVSSNGYSSGFIVSGDIPALWSTNGTTAIELAWPIAVANWVEPRCTIASIFKNNITLATPCGGFLQARDVYHSSIPPPVRAEAVPSLSLAPGVFYQDVNNELLYYSLAAGQTEASLSAAVVPTTEVLATFANTTNILQQGFTYEYATWYQPNSGDGFIDQQSAVYSCTAGRPYCNAPGSPAADGGIAIGQAEPRGAVIVSGSTGVSFEACTFQHLGSVYALSAMESCHGVSISGCTFSDLSGGFVKIGSVVPTGASNDDPAIWDTHASITNNVASGMALEYHGAAALFGGFTFSATVSQNTISNTGYSGISWGWGWGTAFPQGCGNNSITYNRIFNVMQALRDGGSIYVNGATNGSYPSLMAHNWADSDEAVYAVFYLDNGASHWNVTQNVASNSTQAWAYFMTGGGNLPAKSNSLSWFWYDNDAAPVNNCAQFGCVVDQATVFQVQNFNWPAPAVAIMQASGAQ